MAKAVSSEARQTLAAVVTEEIGARGVSVTRRLVKRAFVYV